MSLCSSHCSPIGCASTLLTIYYPVIYVIVNLVPYVRGLLDRKRSEGHIISKAPADESGKQKKYSVIEIPESVLNL